jgi:uncharacterized integral membrane protein
MHEIVSTIRTVSAAIVVATVQVVSYVFGALLPFVASGLSAETLTVYLDAVAQGLSIAVIVGTIGYKTYDYLVDTETDIRQEQIDQMLQILAKKEADPEEKNRIEQLRDDESD